MDSDTIVTCHKKQFSSAENIIRYMTALVDVFDKTIILLSSFQTFIVEMTQKTVDEVKEKNIIEIMRTQIDVLFHGLKAVLNSKYLKEVIINVLSDTERVPKGFNITMNKLFFAKHKIAEVLFFINSYNITHRDGLIKILEYNNIYEPNALIFIGTNMNDFTMDTYHDTLIKCFDNNKSAITLLNTIKYKYINIANNLKIILTEDEC
jgi:hypothetical protein